MKDSVSQAIREEYGRLIKPGSKGKCPFCGHDSFSIKRDDSLGKCFYPCCERFIIAGQYHKGYQNSIFQVLEKIFHDFHSALLAQEKDNHKNAFLYLTQERGIHPQVVADSLMGAIPDNYDVNGKFEPFIADLEQKIEAEKAERTGLKGRPPKSVFKEQLERLIEARDRLISFIVNVNRSGWLCFFYTDQYHRIMAFRYRKPYSKVIKLYKPTARMGVFGMGLFSQNVPQVYKDRLIIVEGEFNALKLQSLSVQLHESYVNCVAVGGVTNSDYHTIRQLAPRPIFFYDNDSGGAGKNLISKASEIMHCEAITTPEVNTDLDSYIYSFGADCKAAWEAVKDLVARRKAYPRNYEGLAAEIFTARQKRGKRDDRREFEINTKVANIIITDLHERGKFYHDDLRSYFFFESEKELIEIYQDGVECKLFLGRYGINRSERLYNYILEALWSEAMKNGKEAEIHQLAWCNPATFTLYLFNHKNQIHRISPETIELVDNGADGVLFLANSKAQPFELVDRNSSFSHLDKVIVSKINFADDTLTSNEWRLIFTFWLYAFFFESIMGTKPILAFIGPKGSGKSITLRKVGKVLFGKYFDVTPLSDDVKDFDAAVTNSVYVAFDNADCKHRWLNDRLATVATGGSIKRRQLYTTNEMVDIPIHCFLAITSRTPYFRRDDVVDRLLIMKVKRFKRFKSEKELLAETMQSRNFIMSELIHHLQDVVRALRDGKDIDTAIAFRIADFGDFAIKIGRYAGVEHVVREILEKLCREQSSFTLEGDVIFDLLWNWANMDGNAEKEVTNAMLFDELAAIAETEGIAFPYKNSRSFAQRMANLRSNLSEFFIIGERAAGGRKTFYTYKPRKVNENEQE